MSFLIRQTLIYAVPLMIVALAGVFAERSGIINLALEGIMIFGAFVGVLFVRMMQQAQIFDAAKAGGALMDLGVYNVSYVVGLFGSPNKVHYAANITRGIDTSGVLTMEYRSFKAVSINAKDSSSPARYIIQGTKGYLLQKSTANFCGGVTFHPYKGKEEHFNLSAGRPRQAAEFHAFARAIESEDMELCSRMLDTSVAVSRVLETARRDAGIRFTTDL